MAKSFIFDLYNTLISIHTDERKQSTWDTTADYFRSNGCPNAEWHKLCTRFFKLCDEATIAAKAETGYTFPEIDHEKIFTEMAREYGAEWQHDTAEGAVLCMRHASTERLCAFDGTIELLTALKANGASLYLLTNAQSATAHDECRKVGLTGMFDGLLISSDCGCCKPERAFFQMLFDKYDIEKSTAVMVGDDKLNDVGGAKAFGIKAVRAKHGAASIAKKLIKLSKRDKL